MSIPFNKITSPQELADKLGCPMKALAYVELVQPTQKCDTLQCPFPAAVRNRNFCVCCKQHWYPKVSTNSSGKQTFQRGHYLLGTEFLHNNSNKRSCVCNNATCLGVGYTRTMLSFPSNEGKQREWYLALGDNITKAQKEKISKRPTKYFLAHWHFHPAHVEAYKSTTAYDCALIYPDDKGKRWSVPPPNASVESFKSLFEARPLPNVLPDWMGVMKEKEIGMLSTYDAVAAMNDFPAEHAGLPNKAPNTTIHAATPPTTSDGVDAATINNKMTVTNSDGALDAATASTAAPAKDNKDSTIKPPYPVQRKQTNGRSRAFFASAKTNPTVANGHPCGAQVGVEAMIEDPTATAHGDQFTYQPPPSPYNVHKARTSNSQRTQATASRETMKRLYVSPVVNKKRSLPIEVYHSSNPSRKKQRGNKTPPPGPGGSPRQHSSPSPPPSPPPPSSPPPPPSPPSPRNHTRKSPRFHSYLKGVEETDEGKTPLLPPNVFHSSDGGGRKVIKKAAGPARKFYNRMKGLPKNSKLQRNQVYGARYEKKFITNAYKFIDLSSTPRNHRLTIELEVQDGEELKTPNMEIINAASEVNLFDSLRRLGIAYPPRGNCRQRSGDLGEMYAYGYKSMKHKQMYEKTTRTVSKELTESSPLVHAYMKEHLPDVLEEIKAAERELGTVPPIPEMGGEESCPSVSGNGTRDLANAPHKDKKDKSRCAAFWCEEQPGTAKGWNLIFPNASIDGSKGVVIKLFDGIVVSWDGRLLQHCSSAFKVGENNHVYGIWYGCCARS